MASQADVVDCHLLAANLNAFALDFVARQKVHGQHLNLVHRRAAPGHNAAEGYDLRNSATYDGKATLCSDHVLRLTYTAQ